MPSLQPTCGVDIPDWPFRIMQETAAFSLSLRERVGVRERPQGPGRTGSRAEIVPSMARQALAASLFPTLSQRERAVRRSHRRRDS